MFKKIEKCVCTFSIYLDFINVSQRNSVLKQKNVNLVITRRKMTVSLKNWQWNKKLEWFLKVYSKEGKKNQEIHKQKYMKTNSKTIVLNPSMSLINWSSFGLNIPIKKIKMILLANNIVIYIYGKHALNMYRKKC